MKVKTNDNVLIIAGKYKGKSGKVLRTYEKTGKVTIEKINIITKHIKKSSTRRGERIQYAAPLNASNVAVICPNCGKTTRIGYKQEENKKKERICKKCDKAVDTKETLKTKRK